MVFNSIYKMKAEPNYYNNKTLHRAVRLV